MATLMIIAGLIAAAAQAAPAVTPVKVTSVEEKGGKLFIHTTAKPEFTAFKLSGPPRVVIDLNGGDVTAAAKPVEIHRAGIAGWSGAQFDEGASRVGRIVVALEADQKYEVTAQGNDLVLMVGEARAQAPAADPNVVVAREDVAEVKNPAHKLGQVAVTAKDGAALVHIGADGERRENRERKNYHDLSHQEPSSQKDAESVARYG